MIDILPFNPIHLRHLKLQKDQMATAEWLESDEYQELLLMDKAYTVISNGEVILCAGVFPLTDYLGRAWALVSENAGKELLSASRAISDFLKKTHYARIDTPVRRDFANGHRWCRLLGFVNETPSGMKYYGFYGETYDLYAFYPRELKNEQIKPI